MIYFKLHQKHKLDIIAHTLTASGIVIWHGIPEKIIQDLNAAGYKIKKRKNFKNIFSQTNHPSTIVADNICS